MASKSDLADLALTNLASHDLACVLACCSLSNWDPNLASSFSILLVAHFDPALASAFA